MPVCVFSVQLFGLPFVGFELTSSHTDSPGINVGFTKTRHEIGCDSFATFRDLLSAICIANCRTANWPIRRAWISKVARCGRGIDNKPGVLLPAITLISWPTRIPSMPSTQYASAATLSAAANTPVGRGLLDNNLSISDCTTSNLDAGACNGSGQLLGSEQKD